MDDQNELQGQAGQDVRQAQSDAEVATAHNSGWGSLRLFWWVALGLLVVLFGLVALSDNGRVAVPDDGVYAAQVELRTEGTWSMLRPAAELDDGGYNSAIVPGVVYRDRQIPYPRHPLFTMALIPFFRAAGFGGMLAFSATGVWIAGVSAGLIARRLDGRYGVPALLLTGLGSPLIFDSLLVSGLGVAAGMSGLVALGLAQCIEDRRWWPIAYVAPAAILLVNIRSEGLILMTAIVLVTATLSVRFRPLEVRLHSLVLSLCLGTTTVIAFLVDALWTRHVSSVAGAVQAGLLRQVTPQRDPVQLAWISLLRPWYGSALNAQPSLVFAVAATLVAALSLKVAPSKWLLPVVLLVLSAGCVLVVVPSGSGLITGLFAATPVLGAGLILLHRADLHRSLVARHLLVSLLTGIGVTVAAYGIGGAAEWGGRFYHVLIPLLVPAAVLGIHNGLSLLPRRQAIIAAVSVVILTLGYSTLALKQSHYMRDISSRIAEAAPEFARVHAHRSATAPGRDPLLVVGLLNPDGTSRVFWDAPPDVDVVTSVGAGDLFSLLVRAHEAGYSSATVVTDIALPSLELLTDKRLADTGWEIGDVEAVKGTPFGLVEFGPEKASTGSP